APPRQAQPQRAEWSVAGREQPVARRERVDEGRFPPAGAGRGKDERLAAGRLEHLLQVAEQSGRQVGERRRAVILHRTIHRAQDALGNVGRPWDEQEVTAGHKGVLDERGKTKREPAALASRIRLSYAATPAPQPHGWVGIGPPKVRGGKLLRSRCRSRSRPLRALRNMRAACRGGSEAPPRTVAPPLRRRSAPSRTAATPARTRKGARPGRHAPLPDSSPPACAAAPNERPAVRPACRSPSRRRSSRSRSVPDRSETSAARAGACLR